MMTDDDHGAGRADNSHCKNCTDTMGNLKSREEVREGMTAFYMQSMGKSREEAEKEVDAHMATMPAWASEGQTSPMAEQPPAPAPEPVLGSAPMAHEPSVAEPGPSVPEPEPTVPLEPTPPPPPAPETTQKPSVPAEPEPGNESGAGGQTS